MEVPDELLLAGGGAKPAERAAISLRRLLLAHRKEQVCSPASEPASGAALSLPPSLCLSLPWPGGCRAVQSSRRPRSRSQLPGMLRIHTPACPRLSVFFPSNQLPACLPRRRSRCAG